MISARKTRAGSVPTTAKGARGRPSHTHSSHIASNRTIALAEAAPTYQESMEAVTGFKASHRGANCSWDRSALTEAGGFGAGQRQRAPCANQRAFPNKSDGEGEPAKVAPAAQLGSTEPAPLQHWWRCW